jgi:uncharacterized membrane protein
MRRHPGVRQGDQLTLGERAADRLRNGMGSWTFVFAALVFLAGWMAGNGSRGFDPYPFILLNLILSCLAAMQGAILLIAARRADQISAEMAAHDYAADTDSEELIGEVQALVRSIHRQVGAPDPAADDFGPATQRLRQVRSDSSALTLPADLRRPGHRSPLRATKVSGHQERAMRRWGGLAGGRRSCGGGRAAEEGWHDRGTHSVPRAG